jgi:hypothetical protein
MAASLERRIDELYGLELEQFTSARNALAAELKRSGEGRADEVRRLAKPTRAAWALNRVARGKPEDVRALLRAGDDVRRAQERRVAGARDDGLDRASGQLRGALDGVQAAAREALEAAGLPATDDTLERVGRTVQAAIVDPELRRALEAGRLAEDARPSGMDALVALAAMAGSRPAAQRERSAAQAERAASKASGSESARRDARAEQVAQARARRQALAEQARKQRQKADAAAREAARAEGEAARLRGIAREEERLASDAEKESSKAAEALRRLVG